MSKNVLFIAVDHEDGGKGNGMNIYERSYLGYIASMLRTQEHNVMVISNEVKEVNFEKLNEFDPDIICLPQVTDTKMIEWAITKKPRAQIAFSVGTVESKEDAIEIMQKRNYIDFIPVGGEVFDVWVDIVIALDKGTSLQNVKGIVYREGQEIKITDDSEPFDINKLKYSDLESTNKLAYIITSLGCIGNCSFCNLKLRHKKWKAREIEDVINEVLYFVENGVRRVQFSDLEIEAPDVKLNRLKSLCSALIDKGSPILYSANFRPDFSRKAKEAPEIMDLLINSGLYQAFIGVESGCQDDLNIFNKRCTVEEALETVKLFECYGVHTEIGFIMFHPFSTLESLEKNINVLEELEMADFDTISRSYSSFRGALLSEKAKKEGLQVESGSQYTFKDGKVTPLFQLMRFHLESLKEPIRKYNKEASYHGWANFCFNYYQRTRREDCRELVKGYINKLRAVKQSMSIILCNWVRKLLRKAREGFDEEKAMMVSMMMLNEDTITSMTEILEREKNKMTESVESLLIHS